MSIETDLITITENIPKVFEAGKRIGRVKHYNTCVLQYDEFFDECYFYTGYNDDYEGYYYCPNMYTQAELDDMTARVEAGEKDANYGDYIAYEVYDTDWNLVYSGKSGMAGEVAAWAVSFGQPPSGLVVGETYYVTRGDYQKQANTNLPIHNFDFEEGKKTEYDRFWDLYQENGKRTNYTCAFANIAWTVETLKPKYDIIPITPTQIFARGMGAGIVNITKFLAAQGIKLDFSKCTSFTELFYYTEILEVDTVDTTSAKSLINFCAYAAKLQKINELILKSDGSQTFNNNSFIQCKNLETLLIKGVIGQNGLNLQWSTKLSHESLMSIINALADKSTDTSGTVWEIILGDENKAKLTSEELQIAQNKNWVVN